METAVESNIVQKYRQLNVLLNNLADILETIEPGGTLVDEIEVLDGQGSSISIAYTAEPLQFTITTPHKRLMIKAVPLDE